MYISDGLAWTLLFIYSFLICLVLVFFRILGGRVVYGLYFTHNCKHFSLFSLHLSDSEWWTFVWYDQFIWLLLNCVINYYTQLKFISICSCCCFRFGFAFITNYTQKWSPYSFVLCSNCKCKTPKCDRSNEIAT